MPKVGKHILILLSGLLWSVVGIFLCTLAIEWVYVLDFPYPIIGLFTGLISGLVIAHFGFSNIAKKNMLRIHQYQKERICIWAFQKWSSYLLIAFMMTLGIWMRTASFIPKVVLVSIYLAIGLALFLSSLLYFQEYLRIRKEKVGKHYFRQ